MRLSWNEVRVRAASFSQEWREAAYEKGETQSFYNDFFEVFDVRRRTVARYEEHVAKLDNRWGFIDLFWPGVLIVEQKSAGRDLDKAYGQAGEYFDALPEADRPRYILVSDFQTFELRDLDERETVAFPLDELPSHVEAFGFILGVQRRTFRDQDPSTSELPSSSGGFTMPSRQRVTEAMTWNASWCGSCSASSPTTPASSSHATSSSTYLTTAPLRTDRTPDRGWPNCSRCSTLQREHAKRR